jgi:hypothetical protein
MGSYLQTRERLAGFHEVLVAVSSAGPNLSLAVGLACAPLTTAAANPCSPHPCPPTQWRACIRTLVRPTQASPLADLLVFNNIKQKLGGRVRLILSGAAPLASPVQEFLAVSMCAPVLQVRRTPHRNPSHVVPGEIPRVAGGSELSRSSMRACKLGSISWHIFPAFWSHPLDLFLRVSGLRPDGDMRGVLHRGALPLGGQRHRRRPAARRGGAHVGV